MDLKGFSGPWQITLPLKDMKWRSSVLNEKQTHHWVPSIYWHDQRIKVLNPGRLYKKSVVVHFIAALILFSSKFRRRFRDSLESCRKGRLIQKALSGHVPDVVISYSPDMTYVLRHGARLLMPLVTAMHCDMDTLLKGNERYFASLESSERIVVLLPSYISDLKKYLKLPRIVCIPNAVPQTSDVCDYSSRLIISTGRVCPQKNHLQAIRSFAIFHRTHPDWRFRIVGDCSYDERYAQACKQEAVRLGVGNEVEFAGVIRNVLAELLKASIFLFPSVFEGFPLALTEAMTQGLACVCLKDCPGSCELVETGKTGLLVDYTAEDIAGALDELARDPDLRKRMGASVLDQIVS